MHTDWIIALSALCGALISIAGFVRFVGHPLVKIWKRVDAFLEDWNGTPGRPGRQSTPSMPERMATVEAGLAAVEKQVTPNGGNTTRLGDRVVRIERALGNEPEGT
ncbi:hypothetical protein [Kribbella sp. NPDC051718]|uniref:hypothetical protein n=1 Tax=Kribbella sp. NPDC051718 TaxID=3155168 RepID=UPI0034296361